jgi:hypothetical protein
MNASKTAFRAKNLLVSQEKLDAILKDLPPDDNKKDKKAPSRRRIIKRGQRTGAWLSVLPSTVNGTELSGQEFRDGLHYRFAITPATRLAKDM